MTSTSWVAKGTVSGAGVTVSYRGIDDGLRYLAPWIADRVFGQAENFHQAEAGDESDLLIQVGSRDQLASIQAGPKLILPFRVHFIADLDDTEARSTRLHARERGRHLARVTRFGYSYAIVTDPGTFSWFYQRMYVPTMLSRHGARLEA